MYMSFNAADLVNERAGRFDDPLLDMPVRNALYFRRQ
jgi:hypothetical protein